MAGKTLVRLSPEMMDNLEGRHDVPPLGILAYATEIALKRANPDEAVGGNRAFFFRIGAKESARFMALVLRAAEPYMITCYTTTQAQVMPKMGFARNEQQRFNFVTRGKKRLPSW
jgi:hypothetical protein